MEQPANVIQTCKWNKYVCGNPLIRELSEHIEGEIFKLYVEI